MSVNHYENFPVASVLLPRRLRPSVAAIYHFAREADDFADEGDMPAEQRFALLDGFRVELDRIKTGAPPHRALFSQLAVIIGTHRLPLEPFYDLLDAFSQDVTKSRYADFAEVMDYCRRSADPVGRLLLHLYEAATEENLAYSDSICSSLQIINFLQDVAIDCAKNRIYMPQDEMARFGVSEAQIRAGDAGGNWGGFMRFQIARARVMLDRGRPLARALEGRIGLELRMIMAGGRRILDQLERCDGDVFRRRPMLRATDWARMMASAVFAR